MVGVAAHPESRQLSVDAGAALDRMFVLFEHQHPAPSPSTKPSRPVSQGRLAVAGSSFRVDRALADAKPPIASGVTVDSAPPQTIMSASPYSIIRAPSPMACRPVVQAVTTAIFGPFMPYMIERLPEIMLMMVLGMKNGEILRGPPPRKSW